MRRASLTSCSIALLVSLIGLLLGPSRASAVSILLNDGAPHTINAASSAIEVRDGAGALTTTLNVDAGADIALEPAAGINPEGSVYLYENSHMNMSGGRLRDELWLFNNSTATVTGGTVDDDITTSGNSHADIHFVTVNDDLEANTSSVMNVYDGLYDEDVESFNSAVVNIYGGTFQRGTDGADIEAAGTSTINIHGGTFGTGETNNAGGVNALVNGVVNIYGGDISGLPAGLVASGSGAINVYGLGGQPASLNTSGGGTINFYEGSLQNLVAHGPGLSLHGTDGSLASIIAEDSSVIRIYGHSFKNFNGVVPLPYGPVSAGAGNLTGVLADGTVITNVSFTRNFINVATRGQIILVPEPGTLVLASLALAGLVIRRRRG